MPRDYAWAIRKRAELCELVRTWFYIWYVAGEGPEELLSLLAMDDEAIWQQWRDFAEIDTIIAWKWTPEKPRTVWPQAYEVAKAMLRGAIGDYMTVAA